MLPFICIYFGLVSLFTDYAIAFKLPHYLKPCKVDPSFDSCVVESARYALPFLLNGDRSLKVPNMNPLQIPLVDLDGNQQFKLKLKNLKIYGLKDVQFLSAKSEFEKRKVLFKSYVPVVTILADYEMNGSILVFPITGNGKCNITLVGGTYLYEFNWDTEVRGGIEYAKTSKERSKYDFELEKTIFHFENLFNGDQLLGQETNKFLNENWMEVNKDLKPPVLQTLLAIHNDITNNIASRIPYDQFFLK